MNISVYHAAPYRSGGDLYRVGLDLKNDKGELVKNYEVWASYEAIQDKLGISSAPTKKDLVVFAVDFFKQRMVTTNNNPPENGAFMTNLNGVYYGDHKTFPGSLSKVDEWQQTNIVLPSSLHEWVRMESVKTKKSLSDLIRVNLYRYRFESIMRGKYADLFRFNEELRQIVDSIFDKGYGTGKPKELFVAFALGKAYKTHQAVLNLCIQGYGQDAAILVRSLLDLAIITPYILNDPTDGRVNRYLEHGWIKKEQMFNHATKENPSLAMAFEERAKNPKPNDLTKETVIEQAKLAQDTYQFDRYDWSDKTIAKMAQEVGKGKAYQTVYKLMSDISHSSVNAMSEYMKVDETGVTVDISPGTIWVEECLVSAFDCFYSVIGAYDKLLELGLVKQLDDVAERYITCLGESQKNGSE